MPKPALQLPAEYRRVQPIFDIFQEEISNSLLRNTGARETSDRFIAHSLRFSTDLRFNASVGLLEDGRPAFTFNLGACLALVDACVTVCCDPAFMEEIPLPPDGVVFLDSPVQTLRFVDYDFAMSENGLAWPFDCMLRNSESDAPRAQLGNHLFEIATKLLALHEQAHVLSGHLLYLRSLGTGRWLELGAAQGAGTPFAALSRAMELEADAKALSILIGGQKFAPGRRMTLRGFWLREAHDFVGFVRLALIGMAVIVGVLDRGDRLTSSAASERTHPSAAARLLNMLEMAASWTRDEFATPQDGDVWLSGVLDECDRVFAALGCSSLDVDAIAEHFNATDRNLLRHPVAIETAQVQVDWSALNPVLKPHRIATARLLGIPVSVLDES